MRAFNLALAATLLLGAGAIPQAAMAAPDGSYRSSCQDLHVYGSTLTANCRGPYGWRQSSIDYKRCGGDIANDDGHLVCRRDWRGGDDRQGGDRDDGDYGRGDGGYGGGGYGGGDGGDRGDWRGGDRQGDGDIVLFSRPDFGGRRFDASRGMDNLGDTGFNDRAQSVQIQNGAWLLCEDSNFRGRCITLSHSSHDLSRLGMDGRISSVRRVR